MLSNNTLSVFVLHHIQNGICNKNILLVQDIMCVSKPASKKYKKVCNDFPNLVILTKSATTGEVQLTFAHASVGKKSLRESVVTFSLSRSLHSTSIVSIDMVTAFAPDGDNIRLLITEVLLCAASGNLALSKNHWYWTLRNAVLLPPFLAEVVILNRALDAGELLKIFS